MLKAVHEDEAYLSASVKQIRFSEKTETIKNFSFIPSVLQKCVIDNNKKSVLGFC